MKKLCNQFKIDFTNQNESKNPKNLNNLNVKELSEVADFGTEYHFYSKN